MWLVRSAAPSCSWRACVSACICMRACVRRSGCMAAAVQWRCRRSASGKSLPPLLDRCARMSQNPHTPLALIPERQQPLANAVMALLRVSFICAGLLACSGVRRGGAGPGQCGGRVDTERAAGRPSGQLRARIPGPGLGGGAHALPAGMDRPAPPTSYTHLRTHSLGHRMTKAPLYSRLATRLA